MTGLSCGLSLIVEQRLSPEIAAEIATAASTLRIHLGCSAAEGLKQVLEKLANSLLNNNTNTANEIKKIISDLVLQKLLIQHAGGVAQKKYDWTELAISYLYITDCVQKGNAFNVQKKQVDGSYLPQAIPLDGGLFKQTVLKPTELEEEILHLDKTILSLQKNCEEKMTDPILNLIHKRQTQVDALDIAQAYKKKIQEISRIVSDYLLKVPSVCNVLYDTHVLSKLDFYVSKRLANKFCNRFKDIKSKSAITDADKLAVLNIAAEFVLVSLGIINPEIFCLQKGEISQKETKAFKEFCDALHIDPITLTKHYQIQTSGTLFWNQYFVQGMKPTKETERKIRNFITETFRDNSDKILEAMQFETVFENIKSQPDGSSPLSRAQKYN